MSIDSRRLLAVSVPGVLGFIFVVAIAALIVELYVYVRFFPGEIEADHSRWGEFGDFLGGTLNPLFALLGLLALLLTIVLQSKELRLSTKELAHSVRALNDQTAAVKLQNFERTFFQIVRLHHDIVKALDIRSPGTLAVTTTGRDCFKVFYNRFTQQHSKANAEHNNEGQLTIVLKAYEPFYREHQHEIGHYFRNFYRILKLVDESDVDNKSSYTGILRAQMSSYELVLLFYNVLNPVGAKLRTLVERYEFLENMEVGLLCNPPDEIPLVDQRAFGDQDLSAYRHR